MEVPQSRIWTRRTENRIPGLDQCRQGMLRDAEALGAANWRFPPSPLLTDTDPSSASTPPSAEDDEGEEEEHEEGGGEDILAALRPSST